MIGNFTFSIPCFLVHLLAYSIISNEEPIQAQLDRLLTDTKGLYQPAGSRFQGVVMVVKEGKVIYQRASGTANLNWGIPNSFDTKFLVGSMSKTFTAVLTLKLVEKGTLKLDHKLTDFLPVESLIGADKVTIHHLLSHTSGLPQLGHFVNGPQVQAYFRRAFTSEEFVVWFTENLKKGEMQFAPSTSFQYNSLNFVLLGLILEMASGKPFNTLLQERIAQPLGMNDTGYADRDRILPKLAASYRTQEKESKDGQRVINAPFRDRSNAFSSGGIYATVPDLLKWSQAVLHHRILSQKYTRMMFSPKAEQYAYGWWINDPRYDECLSGHQIVSHAGAMEGYRANLALVDGGRWVIILLSNHAPIRTQTLTCEIIKILQ